LSLETVVSDLINDWLTEKEVKKLLRRVTYVTDAGELYQLNARFKPTPEVIEKFKASKHWQSHWTMVSGLTPAAALEVDGLRAWLGV